MEQRLKNKTQLSSKHTQFEAIIHCSHFSLLLNLSQKDNIHEETVSFYL